MRDVAEHAGVSAQTVSNLVNNRLRQMSDETRVRIEGAMEQLGYHPNLTARSLRSARTTTIGFLLLDEGARYLADPMTDQVIAGVGDIARDRGYSVLIHAGRPGPARQRPPANRCSSRASTACCCSCPARPSSAPGTRPARPS